MATKVYNRDIFISYRRDKGEGWAISLKLELERFKLNIFLDKHDEMTGDFRVRLLNNIKHSNNFLIIMTPGILDLRDGEDIFREEIIEAKRLGKNIIPVQFNGYDLSDVDWELEENKDIKFLKDLEFYPFVNDNLDLKNASIKKITSVLIGQDGKQWKNNAKDNSNWYDENITEEDMLWMTASNEICKRLDIKALKTIAKKLNYNNESKIKIFTLMVYDLDDLYNKINFDNNINISLYGFCHKYQIEQANELFGENHFLVFRDEQSFKEDFMQLMRLNNIKYFDIVDFELVLKDLSNPHGIMRIITKYLNPNGSACYVRDLDDDFVAAYPDNEKIVERLVKYLTLDPGAGYRHFGKKIYDFFQKTGADEIIMFDNVISNLEVKDRLKILDAYFSYLLPEFRVLVENNPNNETFVDALNWLEDNYETKVKDLFSSKEFYCRSGFIAGVAIYKDDRYYDDDDL